MPTQTSHIDKIRRRAVFLSKQILPRLLTNPPSKWSKDDLWGAIWLHFSKPYVGLIHSAQLAQLESKLWQGFIPKSKLKTAQRRGRPAHCTNKQYRDRLEKVGRVRQEIASELKIPTARITDKQVARRFAEKGLRRRSNPPEYEVVKLQQRFATSIKALKKKQKLGEI